MTLSPDRFVIGAGSVVGREHVRLHRNNQDAVGLRIDRELVVAAVADGCSSGRSNEVGAKLAVELLVARIPALRRATDDDERLVAAVVDDLAVRLGVLAHEVASSPERLPSIVRDHFLFTFLVAIIDTSRDGRAIVFGLGDGVVAVNGATTILDPGVANAPRYLGYRFVETASLEGEPAALEATIHHRGQSRAIESILIATDGAIDLDEAELSSLQRDRRYLLNASLLHKRLVVLSEVERRLRDDTSVVVLRRES